MKKKVKKSLIIIKISMMIRLNFPKKVNKNILNEN